MKIIIPKFWEAKDTFPKLPKNPRNKKQMMKYIEDVNNHKNKILFPKKKTRFSPSIILSIIIPIITFLIVIQIWGGITGSLNTSVIENNGMVDLLSLFPLILVLGGSLLVISTLLKILEW